MQNESVLKTISSFSVGKRNYEIKQSKKFGYISLYDYILNKKNTSIKTTASKSKDLFLKTPPKNKLDNLLNYYQKGDYKEAEKLALLISKTFPTHSFSWEILGAIYEQTGRKNEALWINKKAVELAPQSLEPLNNLGNNLCELGKYEEAEECFKKAIVLSPKLAVSYCHLGNTQKKLGKLKESVKSYKQSINLQSDLYEPYYNLGLVSKKLGLLSQSEESFKKSIHLKPYDADAYCDLGITLMEMAKHNEAEDCFKQSIKINPKFSRAYWNFTGLSKNIKQAETCINKCLEIDNEHEEAKLTKAALRFYQNDIKDYQNLMESTYKNHAYMRSFAWALNLSPLPELYFNRHYFYDSLVKKSIKSRPFYEYGVWMASSFKYLIKHLKKGYGFDTFTGLPEDWNTGHNIEKKGSYSSNGNVPSIKGAEFIVGKFEDTLPKFFSKKRSVASIINFDADLYSSTLCALNFSKYVIDKDTILIFDEFIMHESWENDEYKALNKFCNDNNYEYEVISISFFTKQVAVKIIAV